MNSMYCSPQLSESIFGVYLCIYVCIYICMYVHKSVSKRLYKFTQKTQGRCSGVVVSDRSVVDVLWTKAGVIKSADVSLLK